MQKNTRTSSKRGKVAVFGTLGIMVAVSLLVAMSIVCGKYLAFGVGNVLRFSFENLPIMLAGMLFGPVVGAVAGVAADLIGCVMVGYAINPVVTAGAATIGFLSGGVWYITSKKLSLGAMWRVILSVSSAHIVGSVIVKTLGLSAFYDMPFGILLLWRLLNYTAVGAVEGVLIYCVLRNRAVTNMTNRLKGSAEK